MSTEIWESGSWVLDQEERGLPDPTCTVVETLLNPFPVPTRPHTADSEDVNVHRPDGGTEFRRTYVSPYWSFVALRQDVFHPRSTRIPTPSVARPWTRHGD